MESKVKKGQKITECEKNGHGKITNTIVHSRYGCAIGAINTVSAIKRAIPIANCGPGCADKQFSMLSMSNGFQGAGYSGGGAVPSVNVGENEIVFGGQKKLDDLLHASFKIMDGDLFVVLTGCAGELVGDDVSSVVKKYQKKGYPVVFADTAGFKGNNLTGHEIVTRAIVDQYVGNYQGNKTKNLVNLWFEIPYFDTNWRGDYTEIKRVLEGAGFHVNVLFGPESGGVREWKKIPRAQFNLVVSPWVGLATAEYLQKKYDQPFLHVPAIPIGEEETTAFLHQVLDFAGAADAQRKKAEKFIKKEAEQYYYYLEHFSEFFSEYWFGLPSRFAAVGDATCTLAVSRFLTDQVGLVPARVIITDATPPRYREQVKEQFRHLSEGVSVEAEFLEDGYLIEQAVRNADYGTSRPLVLGTSWEVDLVKEMKGVLLPIGTPDNTEVVLNRSYIGYHGALTLLEAIYSQVVEERK